MASGSPVQSIRALPPAEALAAIVVAAPAQELRVMVVISSADDRCARGDAIIATVAVVVFIVLAGDHEDTPTNVASPGR